MESPLGNRPQNVWIEKVKYQTTLFKMAKAEVPDAQWPVFLDLKCEICEVNNITFKCLNCNEMLCDSCKKMHIKSKMAKNHKVVSLVNAEIYQRNETETKCPTHATEELLMYCNSCQVPLCRDCITSGSHHNHEMVKIENAIDNNRNELSKLIKQCKEKSSKFEEIVKTIDKNSQEFSVSISKKINEVKARNNQLKAALDRIESEYIKHLQDTEIGNQKPMTELKNKLQREMADLNQLIQECESKQGNENIGMVQFVTDVKKRLEKYGSRDMIDVACPPEFIAGPVDDQELKNLFGQLGTKRATTVFPPLPQNRDIPLTSPVIDAKIVGSFTSDKTRIVTAGNDQAWLWRRFHTGLSLVTSDGKVIQDINTDFTVFDAAVTTSGDLLVTVCWGNKVKKLTSHKTFTDIYTITDGYKTRGINVTDTGNVLVELNRGNDSKLVEITNSGQHIRTIQHDTLDNKQLFVNPRFICTNINGDIIVSDNKDKVVAVNKSGTKRFIYDGKERKLQESFDPWYVVTDKYGNIMIADYNNSVVHVLNQDGKFMKYLITHEHGCNKPVGMAIDTSDRLWLCNTGNEEVVIVKYLQ
ncbi:hypothetical protein KUTeg_006062 [Tegillarca granosa]|uniref:B box-type domain-containing protein n=1 Tax=Tegillarca granosa TaxID=220873 RepID=A0ABQ9FK13_TEGGR|nr:hypothetical protein KUTeg_006062 [Tegillarca granosa]